MSDCTSVPRSSSSFSPVQGAALLQPGEVEEVLDERGQALGVALDPLGVEQAGLRVEAVPVLGEHAGVADDRRDGGPQLVRCGRHEHRLQVVESAHPRDHGSLVRVGLGVGDRGRQGLGGRDSVRRSNSSSSRERPHPQHTQRSSPAGERYVDAAAGRDRGVRGLRRFELARARCATRTSASVPEPSRERPSSSRADSRSAKLAGSTSPGRGWTGLSRRARPAWRRSGCACASRLDSRCWRVARRAVTPAPRRPTSRARSAASQAPRGQRAVPNRGLQPPPGSDGLVQRHLELRPPVRALAREPRGGGDPMAGPEDRDRTGVPGQGVQRRVEAQWRHGVADQAGPAARHGGGPGRVVPRGDDQASMGVVEHRLAGVAG